MLLFYRVEGRNESDQWKTIQVYRPRYQKTELFKTERYGLFKLKKRRVIVDCVIHNEVEANAIALSAAKWHIHKDRNDYQHMRISAIHRTRVSLKLSLSMEIN